MILPLLIVSAFSASLAVVPNYSPLFHYSFSLPTGNYSYFNSTENLTSFFLNENVTFGQQGTVQLFPSIPSVDLTLVVIVLFAIAAIGLVYNLRLSGRRNLDFAPLEEERAAQKAEIAKVLDDAISKLRKGEKYRTTVLQCYKLICEILEKKSTIEGSTLTAREFKNLVSTKLQLSSPYLDKVTELFEVARYSESEISESEARSAIDCLENLSRELKDEKA